MDYETIITIICVFCALAILAVSFWTPMKDYLAERRAKKAEARKLSQSQRLRNRLRFRLWHVPTYELVIYLQSRAITFELPCGMSEADAYPIVREVFNQRCAEKFRDVYRMNAEEFRSDYGQALFRIEYPEVFA